MSSDYREFGYDDEHHPAEFLFGPVLRLAGPPGPRTRVLDVGCGNGALAGELLARGCTVVGIDLSEQGIGIAKDAHPGGRFEVMAADQQVLEKLHEVPFDLVVSTEVVEHLYAPGEFALGCFSALKPGGRLVCSTPYHGYPKNVAIALSGKFDYHVHPLRHGGHIKFFSRATLFRLLQDAGFTNLKFAGSGRIPYLWKSMVVSGDRPA